MSKRSGPTHVVVDGSNIATEGRTMPSLAQLNEAVLAFKAEHPDVTITVVVDATFGHRIPKSETAEFDAAVANNELVAPPAGAVGRGDAFVLSIARKADATILSNDSFQEFHGDNDWLFDDGRVIGGKPVPHVGWVFVPRIPVRGPISRKAVRDSKRTTRSESPAADGGRGGRQKAVAAAPKRASKQASLPMPVPTTPPPGRAVSTEGVNDLMPFLEFVERHPAGTSVNAIVDSYSSHGAYVRIGDVRGYVPLRLMGDPPPRSARDVMKVGDAVTLVVSAFAPARRSIDLAVPHAGVAAGGAPPADEVIAEAVVEAVQPAAKASRRRSKKEPAEAAGPVVAEVATPEPPAPTPGEAAPARRSRKKAAAAPAETVPAASPPAPARRTRGTKAAAAPAPVEQAPVERASVVQAPAPAKAMAKARAKKAASPEKPAAKKAAATAPAAEAPAPRTARKTPAKRSGAKKSTASPGPEAGAPGEVTR